MERVITCTVIESKGGGGRFLIQRFFERVDSMPPMGRAAERVSSVLLLFSF